MPQTVRDRARLPRHRHAPARDDVLRFEGRDLAPHGCASTGARDPSRGGTSARRRRAEGAEQAAEHCRGRDVTEGLRFRLAARVSSTARARGGCPFLGAGALPVVGEAEERRAPSASPAPGAHPGRSPGSGREPTRTASGRVNTAGRAASRARAGGGSVGVPVRLRGRPTTPTVDDVTSRTVVDGARPMLISGCTTPLRARFQSVAKPSHSRAMQPQMSEREAGRRERRLRREAIQASTSSAVRGQGGGEVLAAVLGDEHVVLDPHADPAELARGTVRSSGWKYRPGSTVQDHARARACRPGRTPCAPARSRARRARGGGWCRAPSSGGAGALVVERRLDA